MKADSILSPEVYTYLNEVFPVLQWQYFSEGYVIFGVGFLFLWFVLGYGVYDEVLKKKCPRGYSWKKAGAIIVSMILGAFAFVIIALIGAMIGSAFNKR